MKTITTTFNFYSTIALFITWSVFTALFSERQSSHFLIDELTNSLFLQSITLISLFILSALITSKVFQEIWNRFLCHVFEKREISLNESYAVCFLVALVLF